MSSLIMDSTDGQCLGKPSTVATSAESEVVSTADADSSVVEEMAASQPATQPLLVDDDEAENMEVEGVEKEISASWGWLYPNEDHIWKIDLVKDKLTFGRSTNNTFIFTEEMVGKKSRFCAISKNHFNITREMNGNDQVVFVEDLSSNGTFVDGFLIGKGKRRPLMHNSVISVADVAYKPFVYMSKNSRGDSNQQFPSELTSKYIISRELGKGACGVVLLAFRSSDNERVAIKMIDKKYTHLTNRRHTVNVMNEVKILKAVNHPCVIKLVDVIETDSTLFIVLELAQGGELFDKIIEKSKLKESDAKFHFYQIASAIKYLHAKNITHRDLKPENILLAPGLSDNEPLIKITDMGLSKLVDFGSDLKTFCGTPQYLAPEMIVARANGNMVYSNKVDCWSMGVILYILLSGCPPFAPRRPDGKELLVQITEGDYSFHPKYWSHISHEAIDLIRRLMTTDVNKRLTAEQVLQHSWLSDQAIIKKAKDVMWNGKPEETQIMLPPKAVDTPDSSTSSIRKRISPNVAGDDDTKRLRFSTSMDERNVTTPPLN